MGGLEGQEKEEYEKGVESGTQNKLKHQLEPRQPKIRGCSG